MKTITSAQIHRFRDYVSIYLQNGETVYLTADQAKKIAKALNAAARDVKANSFTDSQFKTFTL